MKFEGTLVEEELNEKLGLIFKVSDDDGSGGLINGGTDSGSSADNGRTRDVGSGSDFCKSSEGIKSESVNTAGFNGHSLCIGKRTAPNPFGKWNCTQY